MNTKILNICTVKSINILSIVIVFCIPSFSQTNAYSLSLAGSSSAQENYWSLQDNIAGISNIEKTTAGISVENRFLIKEMKYYHLGVVIPVRWGSNGLSYAQKGFANFRTHKMAYAYSRGFGEHLSAGLKLIYQRLAYSGDIPASDFISFDIGISSEVNKKLILAVLLRNPANIFYSYANSPPEPSEINLAVSFSASEDLILYVSIIKTLNIRTTVNAGIEYIIKEKIRLRIGCIPSPFVLAFGIGINYGHYTIDMASSYHHILGFTPCISVINRFGK